MGLTRTGAAIVLAAGRSERMGRAKAELTYKSGTFLSSIVERLSSAGFVAPVVVVAPGALVPFPAVRLENREQDKGQGWSLALALAALSPKAEYALVTLVDHPAVRAATLLAVAAEMERQPGAIVVPTHQGKRGHPVGWPRAIFGELRAAWSEDGGARAVLARHEAQVRELPVPDLDIHTDVDTPEDYQRLQSS